MHTMMLSLVTVLVSLVAVAHGNININTYQGSDGRSYYANPLYCTYSGSFLVLRAHYESIRSQYTAREDRNCCYLADSRNQCCLSDEGECKCALDIDCGIPAPTTTTTTMPTTTTTMPTTTTTMPTTTTTMPTTTTTMPTTTTTMPTTTTTEPATTTTPFTSLCSITSRILNGNPVTDECPFSGIANITTLNGAISSCNAVYAPAMVNGVVKDTFVTSNACKNIIESVWASAPDSEFELQIGVQRYLIIAPYFNLIEGPDGVAFVDVGDNYRNILLDLGPCQKTACPYNDATMNGVVDENNCKIVSFGTSDAATLTQNGLYETAIMRNNGGCAGITEAFGAANTKCYITASGQNLMCSGDVGAPVYCRATTNGEWILMGVANFQASCDDSNEVRVLPYPA